MASPLDTHPLNKGPPIKLSLGHCRSYQKKHFPHIPTLPLSTNGTGIGTTFPPKASRVRGKRRAFVNGHIAAKLPRP